MPMLIRTLLCEEPDDDLVAYLAQARRAQSAMEWVHEQAAIAVANGIALVFGVD